MPLTRIGWVDGQVVLAEDLITLEDNVESLLRTHVHGNGEFAAVPAAYIPAPSGSVGNVATLAAHLTNAAIHFRLNQNIPAWYTQRVTIPSLPGDQPEYSVDISFQGYATTAYKVFAFICYNGVSVIDLPDSAMIVVEILTASTFRIHVRMVFNPFTVHQSFEVVCIAIGSDTAAI